MKIKKHIPVILTLCVAAAVCGGCTTENNEVYDNLNAKLKLNYSQIVLTVTNDIDEETTLTSEYAMKFADGGMTVTYSVERLPGISLDATASGKTTLVGEAKVAGGSVTYLSGDKVDLDVVTAGTGLNFNKDYFTNVDSADMYFKADVTNPGGFMGSSLNCTDMKVSAVFLQAFYEIEINYKGQEGNSVKYLYAFSL